MRPSKAPKVFTVAFALLLPSWTLFAQSSLTLSSGFAAAAAAPGAVSLNLSLASPSGTNVAAVQWNLTYPTSLSNVSLDAGSALTTAGKTLTCAPTAGGLICIASGLNANGIGNGVVATLSATASGSTSINVGLSGALGATPDGGGVSVASTGITINPTPSPITVSSLSCSPSSLGPGAATTCTVKLSGSSGATVTIGTTGSISVGASSLTIPYGSSSGTFTATAGQFTADQSATVTASLNGSSAPASISLVTSPLVSALQCLTSSLGSNASTTCTVTLTKAAPAGGALVTLAGGIANVFAVPASIIVPANSTTATFTVGTGSISSNQSATVTASLNGSSKSATISLTTSVLISSLQCASTSLLSNASSSCTVTLTKAAPTGGAAVTMSGGISNIFATPPSVVVSANSTAANFLVGTGIIPSNQPATLTATFSGSSKSVSFSLVSSLLVSSLQCQATTLASNSSTTCTVTLNKAASAGGVVITLSGGIDKILTVPASVSIAANATSATFTLKAGTISTSQPATILAAYGSSTAKTSLTLVSPTTTTAVLSSLTCSPVTIQPGGSGTCTAALQGPVTQATTITLKSTNTGLIVPASVNIAAGTPSASFGFSTTSTVTGWLIVSATLGTVTKSVVLTLGSAVTAGLHIACAPHAQPGARTVCELQLTSSPAHSLPVRLSSSSANFQVPSHVMIRPGQNSARFEAVADPNAGPESVTLSAGAESMTAQSAVEIDRANSPTLDVLGNSAVRTGSRFRLHVSAAASDGFPVSLSASQLPAGSSFDSAAGDFVWTPATADSGDHDVIFTATDSAGASSHKTTRLHVGTGEPELTALRNFAGPGAKAACTPGSAATLTGNFLFEADAPSADLSGGTFDLQQTSVSVNGIGTPVLFASAGRVDFLCPQNLSPGSSLEISLQRGTLRSNTLQAMMMPDAPGILTIDRFGAGQALAFRSGTSVVAALPNPRLESSPVRAGDLLSLTASGLACNENFATGRPQLLLGGHIISPQTVRPATAIAGACELTFGVPAGIASDNLSIRLQVVHYDGTSTNSNSAEIAVDR